MSEYGLLANIYFETHGIILQRNYAKLHIQTMCFNPFTPQMR